MSVEFDAGTWGIGIAGSIIAGMTGSFFIQKLFSFFNTREVRNNVKNVIKEELEVNLISLKGEDTSESTGDVEGISTKESTHSMMETWSFESAVKSGNYILLDKKLRKKISEIYSLMGMANRQSDRIAQMTFVIKTKESIDTHNKIVKVQRGIFNDSHKELIPKIESLIKKLN